MPPRSMWPVWVDVLADWSGFICHRAPQSKAVVLTMWANAFSLICTMCMSQVSRATFIARTGATACDVTYQLIFIRRLGRFIYQHLNRSNSEQNSTGKVILFPVSPFFSPLYSVNVHECPHKFNSVLLKTRGVMTETNDEIICRR